MTRVPGEPASPASRTDRSASGVGLVVTAIVSVQVGAALAKHLFPTLGATGVVFLRLGIAALLLAAVWRPHPRRWSRGTRWEVLAFGVVVAAMNTTFYLSLDRVSLGVAVTVEFIGPLSVAAFSSRRPVDGLWVVLALVGVALLARPGSGTTPDPVGLLLAAVAGACWAGYIVMSSRVGRAIPGGSGLAAAVLVAALLTAPVGVASLHGNLTWLALAAGAGVALLSSALPWSLELEALRRLPRGPFGILMSLEPAVAAVSGRLLLHEHLDGRQWAGIVVVVAASAGATTTGTKARDEMVTAAVQP